jgi:hypothetical protein
MNKRKLYKSKSKNNSNLNELKNSRTEGFSTIKYDFKELQQNSPNYQKQRLELDDTPKLVVNSLNQDFIFKNTDIIYEDN